ncbi:benzoate membrane transport protein [Herbaspirillum sp. Sphag1AN]|uniref:benzoate/H(+) symporter BenE family transporter n=1 Tax=unclassified Herbaspirillum TaxID=2624150 RepID=UPI00161A0B9A|nr:benzoate membrane transport protein [Herbaspirillum sp. Sphag1AN]MBB3245235.1 benzoate membrane transport protein [Herbaspirillum sp. Sphag64]
MFKDFSWSALTTGFVVVLVGFTSSIAIVFQAAGAAGATPGQISSWIFALGLAMGVTCIALSLYYRTPVVTAWSTPGAALLISGLSGLNMSQAVGVFMFSALLVTICGVTGLFARVMNRIPVSIAAAMLAGTLLRFGMDVFGAMKLEFGLVLLMFIAYLMAKRLLPRYAIIIVLALGVAFAAAQGMLKLDHFQFALARPELVIPQFSFTSLIGVGIPLFVVTMASQNAPGVAIMRASGYQTPISPLITATGLTTLLLAPLGCFSVCLAAITSAMCMSKEAHEDPAKRYVASVAAGVFYLLAGIFGATVVALFAAFPKALVMAIAGLALFGTIANALTTAMSDEKQREASLVTFLVTASGISLFSVGAAFWGLVAGALVMLIFNWRVAAPLNVSGVADNAGRSNANITTTTSSSSTSISR